MRLEAVVTEFVLEIKLKLIELLQKQAKNPSLAENFIQGKSRDKIYGWFINKCLLASQIFYQAMKSCAVPPITWHL